MVKQLILDVKVQYCLPVYNITNINNIPDADLNFMIDDQLLLQTLLMEIRGKSISYSSYKKKEQNKHEVNWKKVIQELEELDDVDLEELDSKERELESLRLKQVNGSIIRSRARWQEEGENPTSYFFEFRKQEFHFQDHP